MSRRAQITALMRDFGPSLDEVLEFERKASDTLLSIDTSGDRRAQLEAQVSRDERELGVLAGHITDLRRAAADELSQKVSAELHDLAMHDSRFVVELTPRAATLSGADQVSSS